MEMSGEQRIPAPRDVVWQALNDPDVLKASIPGCESLEKNEAGDAFDAQVRAKVGPVNAKFAGTVTLSDINAPESYTISGEGKGGAAGFAKGGAKVHLTDEGAETLLSYAVEAKVGGKLAQLGSRLIDGTARKMADDFFARFSQIVADRSGTAAEPAAPAPAPAAEPPSPAAVPPAEPVAAAPAARAEAAATAAASTAEPAPEAAPEAAPATAPPPPEEAAPSSPQHPAEPAAPSKSRGLSPMVWVAVLVVVVAILLAVFL